VSTPLLKADAPVYTDINGLSKLKNAAGKNDPAAIRTVAQQFEAMFTRMMLKSMRDASGSDPLFGSDQEKMYQDMADDQLSVQMSKGKGLGLADMLVRQLQKMGVKGADAAAGDGQTNGPGGVNALGNNGARAKAAAAYLNTARATGALTTSGAPATTTSASADSASTGAAADAAKSSFVQDLWPQAQEAGLVLGVDPRHLIAQAALETNWGRKVPADAAGRSSNNLFGMKASADWSGSTVTTGTHEFANGVAASTNAQFKAYATPAQSFQDYVSLLRNNPRYASALNTGGDVQAFASGLQRGGYATDPSYAAKIAAVASTVAHNAADSGDLKLASSVPISADTGAL
jgi:flagellar protein FlgJ